MNAFKIHYRVFDNIFIRIFRFYYDGFRAMTVGKKLWVIILIKLFVFFVIMKLFFFPDFLKTRFEKDEERSEYVLEQLTQ
jgi:hypothetical protein